MTEPIHLKPSEPAPDGNIIFSIGNQSTEVVRFAPDGFYVRGNKISEDLEGYTEFYEAMREWVKVAVTDKPRLLEEVRQLEKQVEELKGIIREEGLSS